MVGFAIASLVIGLAGLGLGIGTAVKGAKDMEEQVEKTELDVKNAALCNNEAAKNQMEGPAVDLAEEVIRNNAAKRANSAVSRDVASNGMAKSRPMGRPVIAHA